LRAEPKGALRYFVRSTVLFVTRAFPRIHLREILGRGTPCYTTIVLSKYVRGAERDPDSMEPRKSGSCIFRNFHHIKTNISTGNSETC
jgi:hypothetical protein